MNFKLNKTTKLIINIIIVIGGYFVILPPINLQSPVFYNYVFMCCAFIGGLNYFSNVITLTEIKMPLTNKKSKTIAYIVGAIIIGLFANSLIFSPLMQAKLYANRIEVVDGSFKDEIAQINFDSLPLLDRSSTQKIGDRVMGEIPELISQFIVSNAYTQITYDNHLVRTTPLEYADIFKWFINKDNGIPGYIKVDSTTGVADFINVDGGINYSPSAVLLKNLSLHLRLSFPTEILASSKFEIDEEGTPFWITPVIKYVGIGKLPDIKGVIATNAINGSSDYYNVSDAPKWIDNVYPSSLIINQIDNWGSYQGGFINTIIGQRDVKVSTDGYTYISSGNDLSLYTGITSVTSDESNIGFVLVNLRNKHATYYPAPGAQEVSAMQSAAGAIQEKKYVPTFPLLTNVDNRPTYLLSLKDNAGLVKAYAFVDVADYQKVAVTDSSEGIEKALANFRRVVGTDPSTYKEFETKTGTITDIESVVIEGHTYYYMTIQDDENVYKIDIKVNDNVPFLDINDIVKFNYRNDLYLTDIQKQNGMPNTEIPDTEIDSKETDTKTE